MIELPPPTPPNKNTIVKTSHSTLYQPPVPNIFGIVLLMHFSCFPHFWSIPTLVHVGSTWDFVDVGFGLRRVNLHLINESYSSAEMFTFNLVYKCISAFVIYKFICRMNVLSYKCNCCLNTRYPLMIF